jgi:hypothetical protein
MVCPEAGVAPMVTTPVLHLALLTAIGAEGIALIVAAAIDLVEDKQPVAVVLATT